MEVNNELFDLVLATYIGKMCRDCGVVWENLAALKLADPVCSGKDPLTFSCKSCYHAKT
jgi:hypothetical protein